jgi:hypothetical protein
MELSRAVSSTVSGSLADVCAYATQAPAKQSACSSMTTDGASTSARCWTAWPNSCARTTAGVSAPKDSLSSGIRFAASYAM